MARHGELDLVVKRRPPRGQRRRRRRCRDQGGTIAEIGVGLHGRREIDAIGQARSPRRDRRSRPHPHRARRRTPTTTRSRAVRSRPHSAASRRSSTRSRSSRAAASRSPRRASDASPRRRAAASSTTPSTSTRASRGGSCWTRSRRSRAAGFPSVKFFMNYEGYALPDDALLYGMQRVAEAGGLAIVHAENKAVIDELVRQNEAAGRTGPRWYGSARPAVMEGEAAHRALAIARVAGCRVLLFHATAAEVVGELARAKAAGAARRSARRSSTTSCSTRASSRIPTVGTAFELSPPLRDESHRAALWAGLADGTLDVVSTDHGPRRLARDPATGMLVPPRGTSGIEVRLALVHEFGVRTGRLTPEKLGRGLLHAARRGVRPAVEGAAESRLRRRRRRVRPRARGDALPLTPAFERRPLDLRGHDGARLPGRDRLPWRGRRRGRPALRRARLRPVGRASGWG